ncbi:MULTISPECIES: hypothetical protein [Flavobacterium]|uniref:hypothetical protein n=1 Tax=Flavobacterium TaxID=237 RepID=UPI0011294CE6|nr:MULTISPECIES: hypothetical protein [Flavobacterium]
MKQMSTFILPGMFIVYCYHNDKLRQLIPLLRKQNFSLKLASTTVPKVYVAAVIFFNQFQF